MNHRSRAHLLDVWRSCEDATRWLARSYRKSKPPPYDDVSADDWDALEALAGRFARLTDLVLHKVFRAIDRFELEETGSLLDSSNRAVKRGLVDRVDSLRDFKDIRNEIVHEYAANDLIGLYQEIYESTPRLLQLVTKIGRYLHEKHDFAVEEQNLDS